MLKKSLVKTKVDPKIAVTITVLAILIVGSFVIAAIAPSSGIGNFYAGSIPVPPSTDPLGCCEYRGGDEVMTESECNNESKNYWCALPISDVNTGPDGKVSKGDFCSCKDCPAGYFKWELDGEQGNVCCKQGDTPIKIYVPLKGTYYLCKSNSCPSGETICNADKQSICCPIIDPNNPSASCGVKGDYPYCKNKTGGCDTTTETPCGDNLCCNKTTEECKGGVLTPPYCQPKTSCQSGQIFCQGTGDYIDRKKCCNAGQTCVRHPNGYPYCYQP